MSPVQRLEQPRVDLAACTRGPGGDAALRVVDAAWTEPRGPFPRYDR